MVHKELIQQMIYHVAKHAKFEAFLKGVKVLSAGNGKLLAEMKVENHHTNIFGTLHGGCTATMVDVLSGYAMLTHPKLVHKLETSPNGGVTVDMHLTYMRALPAGKEILVEANTVKAGRTLAFLDVVIKNKETGDVVATGTHTKFIGEEKDEEGSTYIPPQPPPRGQYEATENTQTQSSFTQQICSNDRIPKDEPIEIEDSEEEVENKNYSAWLQQQHSPEEDDAEQYEVQEPAFFAQTYSETSIDIEERVVKNENDPLWMATYSEPAYDELQQYKEEEGRCKCLLCGRTFKSGSALSLHFATIHADHPNIKKCYICENKYFQDSLGYWRHMKKHKITQKGEIPEKKPVRVNSYKGNHKHPRKFQCTCLLCGKIFKGGNSLSIHLATNHSDHPNIRKCEFCENKYFQDSLGFWRHTKKHKILPQPKLEVEQANYDQVTGSLGNPSTIREFYNKVIPMKNAKNILPNRRRNRRISKLQKNRIRNR